MGVLHTNMTCTAGQTIDGNAPQAGDIVKSNTIATKGVHIVYAEGVYDGSSPVSYTLSAAFTVQNAEAISFYRHPQFQIYKFTPAPASTYKYVAECSNRGTCDRAWIMQLLCWIQLLRLSNTELSRSLNSVTLLAYVQ